MLDLTFATARERRTVTGKEEPVDTQPWHGVLVANPVALDPELEIDFDRYAEHIRWLAESRLRRDHAERLAG